MPQNPDVRWRQRFQSFRKALGQLSKAADLAKERKLTELEQQGLIQAFEFTHELAWKTLKDFLEARGTTIKIKGSKDATREALATGLIANEDTWMAMIQSRNESTHTFNCEVADRIAEASRSSYLAELEKCLHYFTELECKQ